jgi:serine/threonine-protein kinase
MGVWDPTGLQVAFSSARSGNLEAWLALSDGGGQPRQLTNLGGQVHVDTWSPNGRTLSLHHHPREGFVPILMLAMDRPDASPQPFLDRDFNAESADFSRDGRYVALLSQENGQREIYIRPFPGPGGQVTVSVGGGREPVWADNGDLFYRSPSGDRMFAVAVSTEPVLRVGPPMQIFQGRYYVSPTGSPRPQFDVTADGERFVMLSGTSGQDSSAAPTRLVIVQHWFEELNRLVPTN